MKINTPYRDKNNRIIKIGDIVKIISDGRKNIDINYGQVFFDKEMKRDQYRIIIRHRSSIINSSLKYEIDNNQKRVEVVKI